MHRLDYLDRSDAPELSINARPGRASILAATRFRADSNSSTAANPVTYTTSREYSPVVSKSGGAVANSGSIAVGEQGKYMESGAVDLSGSNFSTVAGNVSASDGSTINITPDQADQAIQNALSYLAQGGTIPVTMSGSGGGTTVVGSGGGTSSAANINWTLIAIIGAVLAGMWIFFKGK